MAPQRGQQRHDLLEKLRVYPLDKKTVAAFVIDEGQRTVSILNVFYGGRDYETIMSANKS
jgi:plasmid stabilization system protein ParE